MILTTLLTKYSAILQIQYHEELDIISTPWLEGGKEEKKQNYIELYSKENSLKRGIGGCLTDGKYLNEYIT